MPRFVLFFAVLFSALATAAALTQTPAPASPATYDVQVRYAIEAPRNQHVAQYNELLKALKQSGFVLDTARVEDTDPEDNAANQLYGTAAADKAVPLAYLRNVRTVLLKPTNPKPPEDKAAVVRVQLLLAPMPSLERQRQLSDQMRLALAGLGFKEGVSYDHRGHTRIIGSLTVGQLEPLLYDVRLVPAGWPAISPTLLSDLRNQRGGTEVLIAVLYDWLKIPAGKQLVDGAVEEWRVEPPAKRYAATLPLDPKDHVDASVLQEELMLQMARHADARDVLQSLLGRVERNEKGPQLMEALLRRVNANAANAELPVLYRTVAPLKVIEVQTLTPPEVRLVPPVVPAGQERIEADLRELIKDAVKNKEPLRFEVLLARTPGAGERRWQEALTADTDVQIEGRLGSVVLALLRPPQGDVLKLGPLDEIDTGVRKVENWTWTGDLLKLAARDEIVGLRLPRAGRSPYQTLNPDDQPPSALQYDEQVQLHDKGYRGKGAHIAVVDSDFRGWEKAVADGKLPERTRLLDLTGERNYNLEPDPYANDMGVAGFGTRNAINTSRAVPDADLILIRIDAAAPYMLQQVASAISGDDYRSSALDQRQRELDVDRQLLAKSFDALLRERRDYLENYSEDFQKDVETKKKYDAYKLHQKNYDAADKAYQKRVNNLLRLRQDVADLKKARLVSSGLIWNEGYPVDGGSALSRWFDDRPFKAALWFQSAGDARGQTWTGLFRDADGNGVMEFAPADAAMVPGNWTNELNFLAWQQPKNGTGPDLPAKAKVRISLQWSEAHDATFWDAGKDVYRNPLANLKILLVQQLDPQGAKQPADDLQVVAESSGQPLRLTASPNAATYEQTLTFTVAKPGRYAVRVEGRAPDSTRPLQYPTLPAVVQTFELRPRLFVETLDGPGRAVLQSYRTEPAGLGTPGDAQSVIPLGTVEEKGGPQR